MRAVGVPLEYLPVALDDVERWLGPVCSRPNADFSVADLVGIVQRQEGALNAVVDEHEQPVALAVTQVRDHEDGARSCWILALGGSRAREWRGTLQDVEAGARRNGCGTLEFVGRRGWARLLPDYTATPCDRGTHYSKFLGH